MTIYIDVIFIENLCMNYIILFATGVLMKIKVNHIKMIISAALGSIYAIISYMQIFSFISSMLAKFTLSICMIYIAYTPKSFKPLLKYLVIFYLVSFVFGGCAFALLYFVKPEDILMLNGVYIGTYPIKIILLGVIVGFVVIYIAFKIIKNKMSKKGLIYDIQIELDGEKANLKAMLDTGNQLKDPITSLPVIIVEKQSLTPIVSEETINYMMQILDGNWQESDDNQTNLYKQRLRIIPFSSIGKQNGMLVGIKVDKVTVMTDINETINKNVIACIYNQKLSKKETYSALIGLDMLEGRNEDEFITNIKV